MVWQNNFRFSVFVNYIKKMKKKHQMVNAQKHTSARNKHQQHPYKRTEKFTRNATTEYYRQHDDSLPCWFSCSCLCMCAKTHNKPATLNERVNEMNWTAAIAATTIKWWIPPIQNTYKIQYIHIMSVHVTHIMCLARLFDFLFGGDSKGTSEIMFYTSRKYYDENYFSPQFEIFLTRNEKKKQQLRQLITFTRATCYLQIALCNWNGSMPWRCAPLNTSIYWYMYKKYSAHHLENVHEIKLQNIYYNTCRCRYIYIYMCVTFLCQMPVHCFVVSTWYYYYTLVCRLKTHHKLYGRAIMKKIK